MQKIDSENTFLYQKIWKFFSGKAGKHCKTAIIRMKMRRNQASIAEKIISCKKKTYLKYAEN